MKKFLAVAALCCFASAAQAGTFVVLCKTLDTDVPSCNVTPSNQAIAFTDLANFATTLGCKDIGNYAYDCRATAGTFANAIIRGTPPVFPFETTLKSIFILQ